MASQTQSPPIKPAALTAVGAAETLFAPQRTAQEQQTLKQYLPELLDVERLIKHYPKYLTVHIEEYVKYRNIKLPIYCLSLGESQQNQRPSLLMTGGIHGVERIGTQVLLSWLESLLEKMRWNSKLQQNLMDLQIVIVPIVNPAGMFKNRRSNGQGVDLNRNAPVDAEQRVPILGGGHRLSRHLPWYRGRAKQAMQAENQALERIINRQIFNHPFAMIIDLHSGFGMRDRLWFPYASTRRPIGNIDEFIALKLLWEQSYPHHNYEFEPQSLHYLSHGDLWDYFYKQSKKTNIEHFLPLTLEMGSWMWIKKRPRQLLNFAGLFNPQTAHRHSRVLRRHLVLLDFLVDACANNQTWIPTGEQKTLLRRAALSTWYK